MRSDQLRSTDKVLNQSELVYGSLAFLTLIASLRSASKFQPCHFYHLTKHNTSWRTQRFSKYRNVDLTEVIA